MNRVIALCLAELGPVLHEDELATITNLASYDVKLRTAGILPCELARYDTLEDAIAAQRAIRSLGHQAVVVDLEDIAPSERLVAVRRFRFDDTHLFAGDGSETFAFADITALVRIATQTSVIRVTEEKRNVYYGRGAGAELREEKMKHERATANALYLFRREGTPWIVREHEAKYLALGPAMRPTAHENFLALVDLLRARAPQAPYDDRFALHAHDSGKLAITRSTGGVEARHDDRLDLLVWALVRWITRGTGSLYRDTS